MKNGLLLKIETAVFAGLIGVCGLDLGVAIARTSATDALRLNQSLVVQYETETRDLELKLSRTNAGYLKKELESKKRLIEILNDEFLKLLSQLPKETAALEFLRHVVSRDQSRTIEALSRGDTDATLQSGYRYLREGSFEKAEAVFYEAIRIDASNQARILAHCAADAHAHPDDDQCLTRLGYVYYMAEEWQKARSAFREALLLNPGNTLAHGGLELLGRESQTSPA